MLLVLSPAKTLDFESSQPPGLPPSTRPEFSAQALRLVNRLRALDAAELGALMQVSAGLAELNLARFRDWRPRAAEARERMAVRAFRGDVYIGLRADDLSATDLSFAQDHLRILSGLYGVLRPLDRMQPYRLEMGTPLATERGASLYAFWGERIARALRRQAAAVGADTLVNLASQEYFRSVDQRALGLRVVTPTFKERRGGHLKIISFSAKRARGAMAGFAVRNRLREPQALRGFAEDGYRYDRSLSTADEWVFVR